MRKASHCGSKQQQNSPNEITIIAFIRATYVWCCSSRTFRSWWTAHSAQRQPRGCNQARRQDTAAGGAENQKEGPKTRRGGIFKQIMYWMYAATRGPNVKLGGTDFKWGAGNLCPPAGDGPGCNKGLLIEFKMWRNYLSIHCSSCQYNMLCDKKYKTFQNL